ncbi:hypothetical protein [Solitalea lacus]|uniref:hypothetical protein n=1 Tax=Solitalea lacus TaxID=2911172 RepID=UPI001EDB495E|nr:hypothetical protein [Solitalea lacus]UKJ09144.1 hypothetical protein L2B55_08300 [Solitalea lacus]
MKTNLATNNIIEFSPEILMKFRQEGYKSIHLQHLNNADEAVFLVQASYEEAESKLTIIHNSWFSKQHKTYSINSIELEQIAEGTEGISYQVLKKNWGTAC